MYSLWSTVYICTHVHMCSHSHTNIPTYSCWHIHTWLVHMCLHTHVHAHTLYHIHTCMHMFTRTYTWLVYSYSCITCTHTHTHTCTHTYPHKHTCTHTYHTHIPHTHTQVGHASYCDIMQLLEHHRINTRNSFDTVELARQLETPMKTLRGLTAIFLGLRLIKTQQMSNWECAALTESQIHYASADAWVSMKVYSAMLR